MTEVPEKYTHETGSVEPQEKEKEGRQLNGDKMTHYASEWRQRDRKINISLPKLNREEIFWLWSTQYTEFPHGFFK